MSQHVPAIVALTRDGPGTEKGTMWWDPALGSEVHNARGALATAMGATHHLLT
jgi:hypothetical protein